MTISEAVASYKKQGQNSVSPAFREIINQMIDSNTKTEFPNDSYLDALFLTDVMFSRSSKNVRLLTGPNGGYFLEVLSASLNDALIRLKENKGFARIVLLAESMPAWLKKLEEAYSGTLRVALAQSKEPIRHFIVCDSKMSRIEDLHGEISDPSNDASAIKARVSFNESSRAIVFEKYFDEIWQVVEKFPVNKSSGVS